MITEKQKLILKVIKEYMIQNHMPPTVREICEITNLKSTSTIHGYLRRLEDQGYIYKKDNSARSIRLTDKFYNDRIEEILNAEY